MVSGLRLIRAHLVYRDDIAAGMYREMSPALLAFRNRCEMRGRAGCEPWARRAARRRLFRTGRQESQECRGPEDRAIELTNWERGAGFGEDQSLRTSLNGATGPSQRPRSNLALYSGATTSAEPIPPDAHQSAGPACRPVALP